MSDFGQRLPSVPVAPPGPRSREMARRLREVESRNVTFLGEGFPVFWEEARGANVRDADGNVYLDLTAAFGVSLLGHAPPLVLEAMEDQARRLLHGMGDVHPPVAKLHFLEALSETLALASLGWASSRAILATSGSEAVEAALKTAHLATGRPGILAFQGGYHGLTLGALSATARPYFRMPFQARLPDSVSWAPYPTEPDEVEMALREVEGVLAESVLADEQGEDRVAVGAVVVEPVQARGGVRIPAEGFGEGLSELARRYGAVLIADEIYTGMGRCGGILASPAMGLRPDLVCLGKILGGGLPLSACAGEGTLMEAWPESPGEALHTSTFLGHPLACAVGQAVLGEVAADLPARAARLGRRMLEGLRAGLTEVEGVRDVRGVGLLLGIELDAGLGVAVAERALKDGILLLPAGDRGQVVELSPPVVLTSQQEEAAVEGVVRAVSEVLEEGRR